MLLPVLCLFGISVLIREQAGLRRKTLLSSLLVIGLCSYLVPSWRQTESQFRLQRDVTPARSDLQNAFEFLRHNLRSGYVLADTSRNSGSMWMYPLVGVRPLVVDYGAEETFDPLWQDKIYLLKTLGSWSNDPKALRLLRRFRVEFFLFNQVANAVGNPRLVQEEAIYKENLLEEAWIGSEARVFRINLAG